LGLIHAVIPAIEPVKTAFGQLAPDIKVVNILDEGLLTEIDVVQHHARLVRRLTQNVALAEDAGAEAGAPDLHGIFAGR